LAHAQYKKPRPDSTTQASAGDTLKTDTAAPKHKHLSEPDKAAIMSAILPGLGQAGHHDTWWHVPIIYAGFATLGYFIWTNDTSYINYRNAFRLRVATTQNPNDQHYDYYNGLNPHHGPQIIDYDALLSNREYYRRNRDLLIIVTSVWYVANILDSYVFAQLRTFDISNDLTMRVQPLNISIMGNQPVVTCGLKLNLR